MWRRSGTVFSRIEPHDFRLFINEKDNPVAMLYEFLYWHVVNICSHNSAYDRTLLEGNILEYDGIRDVLGLHKMEYVFYNALEFLTGSYWKSEA